MEFQIPSIPIFFVLLTLQVLLYSVLGEQVIAEKYTETDWDFRSGCTTLQVSNSIQSIVTNNKLFLLTNIQPSNSTVSELLIGSIDFSTSPTVSNYEIEWHKSPNFNYRHSFLAGDSLELTFIVETYGLPKNASKYSMMTYDPVTHGLAGMEWPAQATKKNLPPGPLVVVPEQKTTYYFPGNPLLSTPTQVYSYNYSSREITIKPAPDRSWSSAVFVPVGVKGAIIVLGGKQMDQGAWVPINMDEVYVYDIASEVWFLQKTSGDTPLGREESCAAVVSAPDGSSHQIHIYGGSLAGDIDRVPLLENYYVLSVPGFVYTKVTTTSKPRVSATCQRLGSHKMIVIGGRDEDFGTGCDNLFEVIDLNTFAVVDDLRDDGEYQIPSVVVSAIGGGPTGGATMLNPVGGFQPGLESVFAKKYISVPLTANDTTLEPDPKNEGSKTSIGAIVGGVIAGFFAATLLFAVVWWRRRGSKTFEVESSTSEEYGNPYAEMEALHRSVPEMESIPRSLPEMETPMSSRAELDAGPVVIPELDAGPVNR